MKHTQNDLLSGSTDSGEAHFDARLQQALDDRRDPLDDPQLVAWLDAHPERLAAFAALRDDLRALGPLTPPVAKAPRRWPMPLATAAAVAAAVLLTISLRDAPSPEPDAPAARSPGHVLTARLDSHAPRLYAAAEFTVRESLSNATSDTTTLRLEAYRLHHIRR